MAATKTLLQQADYEAYFAIPIPTDQLYMHNVLLTFVNAIPNDCYRYCISEKHPKFTGVPSGEARHAYLRDYVEERLGKLDPNRTYQVSARLFTNLSPTGVLFHYVNSYA